MVVANQALHEDTKVRGPGFEARGYVGWVPTTGVMWVGTVLLCRCVALFSSGNQGVPLYYGAHLATVSVATPGTATTTEYPI